MIAIYERKDGNIKQPVIPYLVIAFLVIVLGWVWVAQPVPVEERPCYAENIYEIQEEHENDAIYQYVICKDGSRYNLGGVRDIEKFHVVERFHSGWSAGLWTADSVKHSVESKNNNNNDNNNNKDTEK